MHFMNCPQASLSYVCLIVRALLRIIIRSVFVSIDRYTQGYEGGVGGGHMGGQNSDQSCSHFQILLRAHLGLSENLEGGPLFHVTLHFCDPAF